MVRGQVNIAHCHFNVVMTQDFLQREDVPAGDHKVCCKSMAQNVGRFISLQARLQVNPAMVSIVDTVTGLGSSYGLS